MPTRKYSLKYLILAMLSVITVMLLAFWAYYYSPDRVKLQNEATHRVKAELAYLFMELGTAQIINGYTSCDISGVSTETRESLEGVAPLC